MSKTEKIILWSLISIGVIGAGYWLFKKSKTKASTTATANQSPGTVQPATGANKAPVASTVSSTLVPNAQNTQQTNFNSGSIASIATSGASVINNLIDSFGSSNTGSTNDSAVIDNAVVDSTGSYSDSYTDPLSGVTQDQAAQYVDEYSV